MVKAPEIKTDLLGRALPSVKKKYGSTKRTMEVRVFTDSELYKGIEKRFPELAGNPELIEKR